MEQRTRAFADFIAELLDLGVETYAYDDSDFWNYRSTLIDKLNETNNLSSWLINVNFNIEDLLLKIERIENAILKINWILDINPNYNGYKNYNFNFDDFNVKEYRAKLGI